MPVCLRNLQGAVGKRLQSARTEWSSAPSSWARGVGIRGATPFVKPLPLSSTQCHRSSVCAGLQEDTCYNSEAVRHGVRCTCSRVVNPVMACQQEDLFRAKNKKERRSMHTSNRKQVFLQRRCPLCAYRLVRECRFSGASSAGRCAGALSARSVHKRDRAEKALPVQFQ